MEIYRHKLDLELVTKLQVHYCLNLSSSRILSEARVLQSTEVF